MNSTVSLPRLWKLLRWQYPGPIGVAIGFAVFVAMFTAFHLFDVGFSGLDADVLSLGAYEAVDSFWTISPNLVCIMTCIMFQRLAEKSTAVGYLMLPATMQEKFIVSLLLSTVAVAVVQLVAFVVADLLCSCLYFALFPSAFFTGLPSLLDHLLLRQYLVDGRFEVLMLLDDLCPLVWWHSLCVLLATVIRRNSVLFALGGLLMLFPFMWLRSHFATELAGGCYDTWTLPVSLLLLALAAFNYVAAYKLFPRRTLVGHKYLAIL